MAVKDEYVLDLSMSDKPRMMILKTVVAYEAGIRGLTLGQALAKLIEEAVDLDAYPDEVLDGLRALEDESRLIAVEKAVEVAGLKKSA